jgi:hypothetical protein
LIGGEAEGDQAGGRLSVGSVAGRAGGRDDSGSGGEQFAADCVFYVDVERIGQAEGGVAMEMNPAG